MMRISPANSRRVCECFREFYSHEESLEDIENEQEYDRLMKETNFWKPHYFHNEPKSLTKRAWDVVCEIIHDAEQKDVLELSLSQLMDKEDYYALNTLPATIGNLKALRKLVLYGSNISWIPREISECENLRKFEPYRSYRLHWLPYEIKRCEKLIDSTISTKALYGNYKLRSPFPDLKQNKWGWDINNDLCSICGEKSTSIQQYWISEVVATDVVPLLVSVCGVNCLSKVGDYFLEDYICYPHQGGLMILQPPIRF